MAGHERLDLSAQRSVRVSEGGHHHETDRKKKLEEGPNQQAVSLSRSVDTTVQGFKIKGLYQPETTDYTGVLLS